MRGQSEATLLTKTLISAEAKKLLYQNYFQLLEQHTIVYKYRKLMQIICRGSKLWKLRISLQCNGPSQTHLQTENSMTGRAYMGEVLTQVWLKSVKK